MVTVYGPLPDVDTRTRRAKTELARMVRCEIFAIPFRSGLERRTLAALRGAIFESEEGAP